MSTRIQLIGCFLRTEAACTLRATLLPEDYPLYVGCMQSREKVQNLVAALRAPAETVFARCEPVHNNGNGGVAVPFGAIKPPLQFTLECIYFFRAENVPERFRRLCHEYAVTDFVVPTRAVGPHILLSLSVAPSWEALPPEYICCMDRTERIGRLQRFLKPSSYLKPAKVLDERLAVEYTAYRAAPLSALQENARTQLEGLQNERPIFYCAYDSIYGEHPLLAPYWRRFVSCKIGERTETEHS